MSGASTVTGDSLRPVSATIKCVAVDHDFLRTYGIPVVTGRDFSRNYPTDSTGYILNVAATKAIGAKNPQELVGRNFVYNDIKGRVIGIMGDFNFEDLHQSIVPMIFYMGSKPHAYYNISVKLAGADVAATMAHIERTWKRYLPDVPFGASFLDEHFDQLYLSEQQQGALFTTFAGIAIFIACLGLLGLSAFAISQRIKEIGIRKVLGASTSNIVTLLSADFLRLIAIAALIAFPIAGYAMHNWLGDFAYHVPIHWWVFLSAGFLAAAVALFTIGFQAIKAALANPVKALRSE
jgi:putative ABC transport system permease protein